jgi:hypothetical protein
MKKVHRYSSPRPTADSITNMTAMVDLEAEYRLTRAALLNAGVDMTDSMDALYRDWRRWREQRKSLAPVDRARVTGLDDWWARHLEQFRSLIDPPHIAARAERTRKDQSAVRTSSHHRGSSNLIDSAPG